MVCTDLRRVQITINDLPVGRSVDEALRLLDAFKFTDEYGEVCPVNWSPGQETMKETTEGKEEYLQHVYGESGAESVAVKPAKSKLLTNGHRAVKSKALTNGHRELVKSEPLAT